MQNLTGPFREDIRDRDEVRRPPAGGRTSFVDARDVGAVGALALLAPHAHTLTGPRAIDYHEVASPSLLAYRRELRAAGAPAAHVRVRLVINLVARLGLAAGTNGETARLLGRPPGALEEFVHEHRTAFELLRDRRGAMPGPPSTAPTP